MTATTPPTPTSPFHNPVLIALSDLIDARSTAGLDMINPYLDPDVDVEETARAPISLMPISPDEAQELAHFIRRSRGRTDDPPGLSEHRALAEAATEAGIPLTVHAAETGGRGVRSIRLGNLRPEHAAALVELIAAASRPCVETAAELAEILYRHGLTTVPSTRMRDGHIALGALEPPRADQLARLLGAPPTDHDVEDPDTAGAVLDRLTQATARVGVTLDAELHHPCRHCGAEPAIDLGALTHDEGRRLVQALQNTPAS